MDAKNEPMGIEGPARVGKSVFKNIVGHLPRQEINSMVLCGSGARFKKMELMDFMSDSDLWKTLTPAVGRCDALVEGRYHRARAFAFETADLYLWCESETGARGTSWFLAKKNAAPQKMSMMTTYWTGEIASEKTQVVDFVERLLLTCAANFDPAREQLRRCSPVVEAWAQALEMDQEAAPRAPKRGQKRSL